MTDFGGFLRGEGSDLASVALCLHKPPPSVRDAVAIMAERSPELLDAYQSTHPRNPEATLKSRGVMASFLSRGGGEQVFLGLFRVNGWTARSGAEFGVDPAFREMWMRVDPARAAGSWEAAFEGHAKFDLGPMEALSTLKGRLIVLDPGGRATMRLAERRPLTVLEIARASDLSPPMPDWRTLALDAGTLCVLPRRWAETLRQWRGVYLITDDSDCARYVGAAYGVENLLGRRDDRGGGGGRAGLDASAAHAHIRVERMTTPTDAATRGGRGRIAPWNS